MVPFRFSMTICPATDARSLGVRRLDAAFILRELWRFEGWLLECEERKGIAKAAQSSACPAMDFDALVNHKVLRAKAVHVVV